MNVFLIIELCFQVFSLDQESVLVDYILKCANHYYGLSITELRELAYQFAKKLNLEYPQSWNEQQMSGKKWYYKFMARHRELSLRTPEQTSLNRVKAFCKTNVDNFFANYGRLMDTFHFEGNNIWNMDESGFSTVPDKIGKVFSIVLYFFSTFSALLLLCHQIST